MDFLHNCEVTLNHLNEKYKALLSVPYQKRDFNAIRIVQDMIADVEFSMCEYKFGYDFHQYSPLVEAIRNQEKYY